MRFTAPLSPEYPNDWDAWFGAYAAIVWQKAFNISFDDWQVDLFRRILELYPEGHPNAGKLRFRQVIVSLGRQNGKTEIAAVLGLYGLLRSSRQLVIGIASSAEQARLVYTRTMQAISSNKSLARRFERLTDTRGISGTDGSRYELKAARAGALQGLPLDLGVVDEVHLLAPALWTALVNGLGGREGGLVVGITTAGDENSQLLKDLYEAAEKAILAEPNFERFGAFIWEAETATVPDNDDELARLLKQANPALEAGRIPLANILSDVRAMPEPDIIRYRMNRFTSSVNVFLPMDKWAKGQRTTGWPDEAKNVTFSVDRTPDWGYAAFTANWKSPMGFSYTELVASVSKPNLEQLLRICTRIASKNAGADFIMDSYALKDLHNELKRWGYSTRILTQADVINASSMFYAKVMQQKVKHAGDPLMSVQVPRTVRKNVGESFRISRKDSSVEIDAVMSTVLGIYGAETRRENSLQIF